MNFYIKLLISLMSIAILLLIPKFWITEQNWKISYILLIIGGWVSISLYCWTLFHSLQEKYELSLKFFLIVLCVFVIGFLVNGTRVIFSSNFSLQQVSGQCYLKALIEPKFQRYVLLVTASQEKREFEIDEKVFEEQLHPSQYLVESEKFVVYPCRNNFVKVTYVPHFNFFVRVE